jgi:peptidoglycan/xylan/chitin deacetylase (PgdA/CDA1 family)
LIEHAEPSALEWIALLVRCALVMGKRFMSWVAKRHAMAALPLLTHELSSMAFRLSTAAWLLTISSIAALAPLATKADPCPGNLQALGTARTIEVSARTTPRIGRKHFPSTLPLRAKELVLTFDDGPWPITTPRILDILKQECVQATFFLLGRNVQSYPQLAQRELAEGHSVGHHTFRHPLLNRMPLNKALAEIDHGIETAELALYGKRLTPPTTPFFRFPGFASSEALLNAVNAHGLVIFGADVWASDWLPMTPDQELRLILARIEKIDHGIVLFHDTKAQTARMLPGFLRELKKRGYHIVHAIAAGQGDTF